MGLNMGRSMQWIWVVECNASILGGEPPVLVDGPGVVAFLPCGDCVA